VSVQCHDVKLLWKERRFGLGEGCWSDAPKTRRAAV
jgi:hypothetical protein